ncbi:MAG: 2-amino-4-hydroxy-6-hydroxymethyldihydropteridine diphosphokinase [Paludibacteraceae bacterium]|nr:2-amino-4-hydroxy-6-hydroxymethyldihydropteridine diphosphokinase [Paludibacteraceae bacterium]
MYHTYRLCMGSNAPNGRTLIKEAISALRTHFAIKATTSTIRTPSLGNTSCLFYFNSGISLACNLTKEELKKHLKQVEIDFGRVKGIDLVTMDIDIIMMDEIPIHEDYPKQYVRYLMNQLSTKLNR